MITIFCSFLCRTAVAITLVEVLDSSRDHFPAIQSAVQETLIRKGQLTAARGAFDLALEQDGKVWASGFYDGLSIDNKLVKPLPWANAKVFTGYRVSNDSFPIYQRELVTNNGGEFSVGMIFSLWRDRAIDDRRFKISKARLDFEQSKIDVFLAKLTTQRNAAKAYWHWVAAGQRLIIYQHLAALAEQRMAGLEKRLEAGDIAEIYVTENRQNLLRRRAIVREAKLAFRAASIELSLYLRNENGQPILVSSETMPTKFNEPQSGFDNPDGLAQKVIARRPELFRIENRLEVENERLKLAENVLKPKIDIGVKASNDIGRGDRIRKGFESIIDISISIPLERLTGEGQIASVRAQQKKLEWDRMLLENKITTEITKLATTLNAARDFVVITKEEAVQAKLLEEAERIRFQAGDSDFFLVNLREERSADAQVRNLQSKLQYYLSKTDLQAITMDLQALRLVLNSRP